MKYIYHHTKKKKKWTKYRPVILEILAPQGDAIYMVRVPGVGRLMLSLSGESASVTNVRSGEKERYIPEDIRKAVLEMVQEAGAEESRQQEYGEHLDPAGEKSDEKEEAAQPKEKRKDSKVVKAAPPKSPGKKAAKVTREEVWPEPKEEPLPGQMEVMDYPEAIPDAHFEEITEAVPAEPSGMEYRKEIPPQEKALEEMPQNRPSEEWAGREGFQEIRREVNGFLESLRKAFSLWDGVITLEFLGKIYPDAVNLAAVIEKLMDIRINKKEGSGRF